MHATLHWTDENVVHTIYLDSLTNHEDYCRVHDWILVRNGGVDRTGISVTGLFVKAIYINITLMVVNNEYIRTYYTGVCM